MKKYISFILLVFTTLTLSGQTLYTKTFGNSKNQTIIYLHGGPGYNSVNFEATTAQKLADNGFYVVVYDRRGEGRSEDTAAKFTFQETFDDLNGIYKKFGIENATLIGHSFGGVVAILFAEKYPEKIHSIVLVGAPVSLQETFKTIIKKSKDIYQGKNYSTGLNYISMLEKMDSTSIEYSSYCFMHAMQNGFYSPDSTTEEAKSIYKLFKTDSLLLKYAREMTREPAQGFWKNEKYTTIDLTSNIKDLESKKVKIFGLYGKDDGLYSTEQVLELQKLIGPENLNYFDNCSHNVFIDQQSEFIASLKTWLASKK